MDGGEQPSTPRCQNTSFQMALDAPGLHPPTAKSETDLAAASLVQRQPSELRAELASLKKSQPDVTTIASVTAVEASKAVAWAMASKCRPRLWFKTASVSCTDLGEAVKIMASVATIGSLDATAAMTHVAPSTPGTAPGAPVEADGGMDTSVLSYRRSHQSGACRCG